MGETGVGKTCLVRYLSQMIQSCVFILDIHTGRSQKEIIDWIKQIKKLSKLSILELKNTLIEMHGPDMTDENKNRIRDPLDNFWTDS